MTPAEELYHKIATQTPDATQGKMFGALCLKAPNNKAGVLFKNDSIAFKLEESLLNETLSLDGAQIFEPADGRPMNGWVQVPYSYSEKWPELAQKAMEFVKTL
ncbi:hypothetical protein I5M27_03925 [Adhaeribacter sp. BT258]|uniref:TfoX N-terminal domain-containing protein n=1 Tax=Adhaeribacter terrigena TaxID=2793070 RepID=A0ABS1BY69_9BACT|nr:hypothetical protein [Adhaeribacter terrigena]MBK0402118.1 hypothetical protein [Adhaeribacter terrigena]